MLKTRRRIGTLGAVPFLLASALVLASPAMAIPPSDVTHASNPADRSGGTHEMPGAPDMPGMDRSGGTADAPRGPEPARDLVLAGFGIVNLLVILVAAAYRISGRGSPRRRNAARVAAGRASISTHPIDGGATS